MIKKRNIENLTKTKDENTKTKKKREKTVLESGGVRKNDISTIRKRKEKERKPEGKSRKKR